MTVLIALPVMLAALNSAWAAPPIGLAAIERLEDASLLRPWSRICQYSSHEPSGGNGDSGHFLQTIGNERVLLDVKGPGCIQRIWWFGEDPASRTIRIYFDGATTPLVNMRLDLFFNGLQAPFLSPLVGNGSVSSGGNYCYLPMPFRTGCRITLSGLGTMNYYNITYQRFADTQGIITFTGQEDTTAARYVWNNCGTDPKPDHGTTTLHNVVNISNGATRTLANISTGGTIQEIEITIPTLNTNMLTTVRLLAKWDGAANYAIDAPLGYFFGCGLGVQTTRALPLGMDSSTKKLYCYLPMPFGSSALVQLVNNSGGTISNVNYYVRYTPGAGALDGRGYLNAKYLYETPTIIGRDYTVLNETGGGHFIGVVHTTYGPDMVYLEGDERIYVDGSLTPQIQGTGTEDFYNGASYFSGGPFIRPVHGYPMFIAPPGVSLSLYRFFLQDAIPFTNAIKVGIEHNCGNEGTPDYRSVAFYYKSPQPLSTLTDTLDIGDGASESAHAYTINNPTWSGSTTGYYEGDDDTVSVTDDGRRHAGYSQFTISFNSNNGGLLLRRRMDYSLSRQDAQVYVDNELAGVWYEAGGNDIKIFRDSEFLVPGYLTLGKTGATIKIVNTSTESNWTEYRYWVYSLPVQPPVPPSAPTQFDAAAYNGQVGLCWTNPIDVDFSGAVIRYRTDSYPSGPTDGTQVCDRTAAPAGVDTFTHTGLSNGVTYYYSAFAYDRTALYSGFVTAMAIPRVPPEWIIETFDGYANGNLGGQGGWATMASGGRVQSDYAKGGTGKAVLFDTIAFGPTAGNQIGFTDKTTGSILISFDVMQDAAGAAWEELAHVSVYGSDSSLEILRIDIGKSRILAVHGLGNATLNASVANMTWNNVKIGFNIDAKSLDFWLDDSAKGAGYAWKPGASRVSRVVIWSDRNTDLNPQKVYIDNLRVEPKPGQVTVVTDDGAYTPSLSRLHFSFPAVPGTASYRYAVGTTSGGTQTRGWTSCGTSTDFMASGLALVENTNYYVSVACLNQFGTVGPIRTSNGIKVAPGIASIPAAEALSDGQSYEAKALRGKVVTTTGSGFFYIQEPPPIGPGILPGPYGLRVVSATAVAPGDEVDVAGPMRGAGSERYLDATGNGIIIIGPGILPGPAVIGNRALGGAGQNAYTPGVVGGIGPNNIGLYVTVYGKVTQRQTTNPKYFYIDDGSGLKDGTTTGGAENIGVKIAADPSSYPEGGYVSVTGAVSCFNSGGLRQQILPRSIQLLKQ